MVLTKYTVNKNYTRKAPYAFILGGNISFQFEDLKSRFCFLYSIACSVSEQWPSRLICSLPKCRMFCADECQRKRLVVIIISKYCELTLAMVDVCSQPLGEFRLQCFAIFSVSPNIKVANFAVYQIHFIQAIVIIHKFISTIIHAFLSLHIQHMSRLIKQNIK